MKVLAVLGSPREKGNCAFILDRFREKAEKKGHEFKVFKCYKMSYQSCLGCDACKSGETGKAACRQDDDFHTLLPYMIECDLLIFTSPIYLGQITGTSKQFLDRFACFIGPEFHMRDLPGKSFVSVVTCGTPSYKFEYVNEYLNTWLSEFFGMRCLGQITAGELYKGVDIKTRSDIIARVDDLSKEIF